MGIFVIVQFIFVVKAFLASRTFKFRRKMAFTMFFQGCLGAKFNSTGPFGTDKCVFMVIFCMPILFQLRVEHFLAQGALLLVCTGTPTYFVLLLLENSGFAFASSCLFWFGTSGSSTGSCKGSAGWSGGGGLPIDLHGFGDPNGDSGVYTKSLLGSCLDVDGLGVPIGLQGLALLSIVSRKVPPRYTNTMWQSSIDAFFLVNHTPSLVITQYNFGKTWKPGKWQAHQIYCQVG